jgi:hypothetical protein
MSTGAELPLWKEILAWLSGAAMLIIGVLFKRVIDKHDQEIKDIQKGIARVSDDVKTATSEIGEKIGHIEMHYVPEARYEQNRREVREGMHNIFGQLNMIGQSLARIEGKLGKE